jgi:hypothetical protein
MDNDTRRTLIPSFFPPLMTPRSYPFFCFAYSGSTSVMTISTNACLKLGLLHRLFFFFWNGLCNTTNGRKTHAVFCISISLHWHHERSPQLATRRTFRAVPSRLLHPPHTHALACCSYFYLYRIVQRHASVCMSPGTKQDGKSYCKYLTVSFLSLWLIDGAVQ